MTAEIVVWDNPDRVALIKRTLVPEGITDDEFELFATVARRAGLDPFAKQIYAVKRKGRLTVQTGIDGYRLIADRTGRYAGSDNPTYTEGDIFPATATVTVWKLVGGQRCPFTATARWSEYYPGDGDIGTMWRRMPHTMLAKCAEALALRKAFPADLSGIYTADEMDQAAEMDQADATPATRELADIAATRDNLTARAKALPADIAHALRADAVVDNLPPIHRSSGVTLAHWAARIAGAEETAVAQEYYQGDGVGEQASGHNGTRHPLEQKAAHDTAHLDLAHRAGLTT